MSASMVFLKSMLVIGLGQKSWIYAFSYIAFDLLVYLAQKIMRRDYTIWLPIKGCWGVVLSGMFRVIIKLISDFTGCIHFRHPYEVGGLYFTLNFLSPLFGMALLLTLQSQAQLSLFHENTFEYYKTATIIAGSILMFMSALFLMIMNPRHRRSFFSIELGWQMTRRIFLEGDDAMKAEVFDTNIAHWEPIRDNVEDWVRANWHLWKYKRPDWFTDHWIALVPLNMIPEDDDEFFPSERSTKKHSSGDDEFGRASYRKRRSVTPLEKVFFHNVEQPAMIRHSFANFSTSHLNPERDSRKVAPEVGSSSSASSSLKNVKRVKNLKKAETLDETLFKHKLSRRGLSGFIN
ncbi:hypothetical protein TrST_g4440 [Triparma strigata]|nr:hypothetical protein TrST_g4440 [Triparma strigata]